MPWNGRVVRRGKPRKAQWIQEGDTGYSYGDAREGELPGTIEWPASWGPPPKGFAIVRRIPHRDTVEISEGPGVPALRLIYGVQETARWVAQLGPLLAYWWQQRPRGFHWTGTVP